MTMRIATSTIYAQQTAAIDQQAALYAQEGAQLSTGKKLNEPSDDPAQISQDLNLGATIATQNQQTTNITDATSQLTTTDSALGSLTSVLQSARQLAIQGASDTLTASQRSDISQQLDQLLQQSVAIGNTQYNGTYIFAGTNSQANPPMVSQGNPINGVAFTGNDQVQGQLIYNGQEFALSTSYQAAFNGNATDGSPDVFQVLTNLRDSIGNATSLDQSAAQANQAGTVIDTSSVATATPLSQSASFAVAPVPDNAVTTAGTGAYTIQITGTNAAGVNGTATITLATNAPIADATPPALPTAASVVGAINAQTGTTGVTATWNAKTQKISLSGVNNETFTVQDVPTPLGATVSGTAATVTAAGTTTGNLTKVLSLSGQSDFVDNVSTQLGDIDNVLNRALTARATVGARIQTLSSISSQLSTQVTDNKSIQSGIEDVDVASATSAYSATETALQAAYATTTRLESKTLFDYLS